MRKKLQLNSGGRGVDVSIIWLKIILVKRSFHKDACFSLGFMYNDHIPTKFRSPKISYL